MSTLKRIGFTLIVGGLWAFLSTMAIYNWDVFNMGANDWKAVLVGVMSAVGTIATQALLPWYKDFGVGSK